MDYVYQSKVDGGFIILSDDIARRRAPLPGEDQAIQILWNRGSSETSLEIDGAEWTLMPGQIVTTTYLHRLRWHSTRPEITALRFNREFYCIIDHDDEVSCNGILFFGTQELPVVDIPAAQQRKFQMLFEVLVEEFLTPDRIQGGMLQMVLKRLIILLTRLATEQHIGKRLSGEQVDIIRRFNVLVDAHFREKRKVSDYAEMLYRSPKTLSNLFAIYNEKSPQQIILDRLALEAKRLLRYTDKQHQEIAYELGFSDASHFSRFFRKMTSHTPRAYRERLQLAG